MKSLKTPLLAFASIVLFISFTSCMSTETLEPESENIAETSKIVLNIKTPTDAKTRADASTHKLRYVAKLYRGNLNQLWTDVSYRKEIIEGDDSEGEEANQIIFDVVPGTYSILVFADYIPIASEKNSKGYFSDYYYDTNSSKDMVEIMPNPGNLGSNTVSADFFNNDNYDCFMMAQTVDKTELKLVLNMTLPRVVSKVRFVDNSKKTGNYNAAVSEVGIYRSYDINNNIANFYKNFTVSRSFTKAYNGADEQEVIYFYTFATKDKPVREKVNLSMTVSGDKVESQSYEIANIDINQNYITTIKGRFLTEPEEVIPDTPEVPDDSEKGPIYVNLAIDKDNWQNITSQWP